MKSIFRTIVVLLTLLAAVSCNIDFMYIQMPNTSWSITEGDQRAFAHFSTNGRATILQRNTESSAVQMINGTYTADGHAVDVVSDEGSTNRLIRTFSHLKSSKNKNFSTFKPEDYADVDNTVWATILRDNLHVYYFEPDGTSKFYTFVNVRHEEGLPYGWSREIGTYSLVGSHLSIGNESAILFPEVMLVDDTWYMHFPPNEDTGKSDLKGTAWTYVTSSFPGMIIFDTNSSFTRILVASRILFQASRGTYTQDGDVITMTLDGKIEQAVIADGKFTFMERTFSLYE